MAPTRQTITNLNEKEGDGEQRERGRQKEKERQREKIKIKRDLDRERVRKKEKIKRKYIATCYSKVLIVTPSCSKLLKLFTFGTFDVEHVLVF